MKKAAIIGGSGYVAGELIRLLLYHPYINLSFVYSQSNPGQLISQVHTDLMGESYLKFSSKVQTDIDVLFLCQGHGNSKKFLEENQFNESTLIIDLSSDFRFHPTNKQFVYGLSELNRKEIQNAGKIANPGCFATAIELALIPLLLNNLSSIDFTIQGITGSTGAGHSHVGTSHFSWRNNNLSVYKAFTHQHLDEVYKCLQSASPVQDLNIQFIPVRGDFARGIFLTIHTKSDESLHSLYDNYIDYYKEDDFVHVSTENITLKQVVNTNKCHLHLIKEQDNLLIISVIDNLMKGAAGQAVQNMNIALGFEEKTALQLKAMVY